MPEEKSNVCVCVCVWKAQSVAHVAFRPTVLSSSAAPSIHLRVTSEASAPHIFPCHAFRLTPPPFYFCPDAESPAQRGKRRKESLSGSSWEKAASPRKEKKQTDRGEKCIRWTAAPLPWCFCHGGYCTVFTVGGGLLLCLRFCLPL